MVVSGLTTLRIRRREATTKKPRGAPPEEAYGGRPGAGRSYG
jgi:hypothetical protein